MTKSQFKAVTAKPSINHIAVYRFARQFTRQHSENIVPSTPYQGVCATTADQRVRTRATVKPVPAAAAVNQVGAGAAKDGVVAFGAQNTGADGDGRVCQWQQH